MAESSSNSSSDSLTEQELQLLKKLSKKYEQKEMKEKKFFGGDEFNFKELFEFQGWMSFLSLNALCYESLVKEFYGSLKASGTEAISVKLQGEFREFSYDDFGKIFGIPNAGSKVTKIKDVTKELEEVRIEEKEKKSTVEKEETEKESTVEKEESEKKTGKKEEPEKSEKGKKVEEGSDAETEKLEISDEEKTTEDKTEQESELQSAQRSREIMLGRIEKELIEKHNKEIDEAIQQSQTIIEQNQSLIKTLEKMKDVNMRKLATLRVKGTTYIPSSEKPKHVKHTAGKHRTHGKKPPLHPSSNQKVPLKLLQLSL
ncbi:hypothetical protein JCGZ_22864 [Jatropha curcas]|uniref:Uncharacterized protein n=1 Tax=Jatropha curcas TaxID=180498 RepID=A0A067JQJ2_JATCU|nr:hypothetical protein JCGZ_22864 [Jatropha curcas]